MMVPESEAERLRFIAGVLGARPSWCHVGYFRVAEVDGAPAAALSAYPAESEEMAEAETILPEVARAQGWSEARLAEAFRAMAPFLGAVPDTADDEAWNVEWVATEPAFRRRGLVAQLLDEVLEAGHRRGHRNAQLLILIGNDPARRAYEKHGFRVVEEKRFGPFEEALGSPGLARMEAPL